MGGDILNILPTLKRFTAAGNFTFTNECGVIIDKASGAATTVNLPPISTCVQNPQMIIVVDGKGDAGTNNITVDASGAETINGATTRVIASNYGGVILVSAGDEWNLLATFNSGAGSGPIGYAAGSGGAVTQLTNRTTGVTLNKLTGQITTDTTSLAAESQATFTVTNSLVAIGDVIAIAQQGGSNGGMTQIEVSAVAAGSFAIKVLNNNPAAGAAETGAIIINFAVIKGQAA